MNIELYLVKDDKLKAKKTLGTPVATKNVSLVEPCSQLNPTFLMSGDVRDFNYIKVPAWGNKYYFVSTPTFEKHGMISFECHEDTLMTYWDYISTKKAFIERSESLPNKYIIDDMQPMLCSRNIRHLTGEGAELSNASGAYIAITVAGGETE